MSKEIRLCKLSTREELLTFRKFFNLDDCRFFNHKGNSVECIILDPGKDEIISFFKNTPPKIGSIFKVMITRSKNRAIKKRIITAIIKIDEPTQMDIEDFINEK